MVNHVACLSLRGFERVLLAQYYNVYGTTLRYNLWYNTITIKRIAITTINRKAITTINIIAIITINIIAITINTTQV